MYDYLGVVFLAIVLLCAFPYFLGKVNVLVSVDVPDMAIAIKTIFGLFYVISVSALLGFGIYRAIGESS